MRSTATHGPASPGRARGTRVGIPEILLASILLLLVPESACADFWGQRFEARDRLGTQRVVATSDCGWLAMGWLLEPRPGEEPLFPLWIMKVDATGAIEWSKIFEATDETHQLPDAAETPDGGFLIATDWRWTQPWLGQPAGTWIAKLDASGAIEWQKLYAADQQPEIEQPVGVAGPTADEAMLVTGLSRDPNGIWLLKVLPSGQEVWLRTFDGPGNEGAFDLERIRDGGFLMAATTDSWGPGSGVNDSNPWLVKLDPYGEVEWQKVYGVLKGESFTQAEPTGDGQGYVMTARIQNEDSSDRDLAVVRLGLEGEIVWQQRFHLPFPFVPGWHDVASTREGGALVGISADNQSQFISEATILLQLDAAGNLLWSREYGGTGQDEFRDLAVLEDGTFLSGGATRNSFSSNVEAWLLRLDQDGLIGGQTCSFIQDLTPQILPLDYEAVDTDAIVADAPIPYTVTDVVPEDLPLTVVEQCRAAACVSPRCGDITAVPASACEGEEITLRLASACGEGSISIAWDLDGDTVPDDQGYETTVDLPAGEHVVTATATDACPDPGPQSCDSAKTVTVLPTDPPGEVSGSAEPRLRVIRHGEALVVEDAPEAARYNAYVDRIGSWYAPTEAKGGACGLTAWTDAGGGAVELDHPVPTDSWIVVTASTPCAEGPAGPDSAGAERTTMGTWQPCGPTR